MHIRLSDIVSVKDPRHVNISSFRIYMNIILSKSFYRSQLCGIPQSAPPSHLFTESTTYMSTASHSGILFRNPLTPSGLLSSNHRKKCQAHSAVQQCGRI